MNHESSLGNATPARTCDDQYPPRQNASNATPCPVLAFTVAMLTDPKREARRLARLLNRWPATVRVHRILDPAGRPAKAKGTGSAQTLAGYARPGIALVTDKS